MELDTEIHNQHQAELQESSESEGGKSISARELKIMLEKSTERAEASS